MQLSTLNTKPAYGSLYCIVLECRNFDSELCNHKLMDKSPKRIAELAPCGVYCGACPSFGRSCNGCASENTSQKRTSKWGCKIRNCCYEENGLNYCIDCDAYPCDKQNKKLLKTHIDDPRFRYRHELTEVFPKMKESRLNDFLEFQKNRWACPNCGGTIRFYHYKCDDCDNNSVIN